MKRFFALLLAAVLLLSIATPAVFAETRTYIFDETEKLSYIDDVEALAEELFDNYGAAVCYASSYDLEGYTAYDYAEKLYRENVGAENGMLLLDAEEADAYQIYFAGEMENLSSDDVDALYSAYRGAYTYDKAVNDYYAAAKAILAGEDPNAEKPLIKTGEIPNGNGQLVCDYAGIMTDEQKQQLYEITYETGKKHNCDVVFVTMNDLQGYSRSNYAMDFYDYGGYKPDGVLLLLALDTADRGTWICTTGECIRLFPESEQDTVHDKVYHYLPEGKYFEAMMGYAEGFRRYLSPYVPPYMILVALLIGFGVALAVAFIVKSQLKSVKMQSGAASYVRPGSMKVNVSRDTYLYSTVTRTEKPKDSGSSGGGGGFTGSSGTSHGGSGRSF